jgi:predicted component of type VI protein secretion system
MDLKLRVLEGKNAGQEIAVASKKFLVGRAEDCHLRPGSDLISRHHCVLLVEDGYLAVRDFGSKNGTYVNKERVVGERELKAGDHLTIGPLEFEIHIAHGLGAKKRPPVGDIKEAAARTAQDATQDTFDVGKFLSGDTDVDRTAAVSKETQTVAVGDTEALDMSATQTFISETPAEEEKPKGPHVKKPAGRLPPIANAAKDSQSAATNALNKFRKRR